MTESNANIKRSFLRRMGDRLVERMNLSPARRKWLIRTGIAAGVITVLVIIPGYLAARPSFLARYDNMSAEVETWETSVHAKVSCQRCHVSPDFADQAKYSARMLGEFYISWLSREPDVMARPTTEACSKCHIDLRTVSPSGDLNIPHRAHVELLELDCVECHIYLVHELSPEGKHVPRMVDCLTCHDGETAKNACATCHTEKATPDSHKAADWKIVHPAMQEQEDCEKCHAWTEDWCVECHTRRPTAHEGKWRSNHRYVVEERRNCEACHKADFCIKCHGEVPQLNFDPALKLVE